jgi:hypothetical protein
MAKRVRSFLLFGLTFFACAAFVWFTPTQVAKRQVRAIFQDFSQTVDRNDRKAVRIFLEKNLAEDAAIQLDVSLSVLGVATADGILSKQKFTKETFIQFIDNTLFSLESYAFNMSLKDLMLQSDGTADIKAVARANASGLDHLRGRRIATRWVLKTKCDGSATLGKSPQLNMMHCTIDLNREPDLKGKTLHEVLKDYEKSQQK